MDDTFPDASDGNARDDDRNLALWCHGWMVGRETAITVCDELVRELDPQRKLEISRVVKEITRRISQEMPNEKYNASFSEATQAVLRQERERTVKLAVDVLNSEATDLESKCFQMRQAAKYVLLPLEAEYLLKSCDVLSSEAKSLRTIAQRISYMTFSDLTKIATAPANSEYKD